MIGLKKQIRAASRSVNLRRSETRATVCTSKWKRERFLCALMKRLIHDLPQALLPAIRFLSVAILTFTAGVETSAHAQAEVEKTPLKACAVLSANRTHPTATQIDTARIQSALNRCSPGKGVVLKANGANAVFESAPLLLPRGVTLFVAEGVTLYASRNPRDYDLRPASCGAPSTSDSDHDVPSCKPFLLAYQAAFSGVAGGGVIDGQGGVALIGKHRSWWELVRLAKKSVKRVRVPDLVSSYESQGFRMIGITLRNAAGMHAAIFKTTALLVSGLKVDSPENSPASTVF